ncbi:MAG: sulfite reductase flavoprotein alpha-component [Verrucomicrobiota bacterium]|jgi:sulfite reductase (NADPH) flavoprotein alpha-component
MNSTASTVPASSAPFHRKKPFHATLLDQWLLTKAGSEKETRHVILSLAGSGLVYTPGDSLGVFARNPLGLVDEVISLIGLDPAAPVPDPRGAGAIPFRQALQHGYILNRASKKIMSGLAARMPQGEQRNRLMEIVDNGTVLSEFIETRDYVDILTEFDEARFETPGSFLEQLSPIPPRLYSIASSLAAHPDAVHLCVAVVRYQTHGRKKTGLCSGYLADQVEPNQADVPVYVQESKTFRLPQDGARDIIMIGPGTGIAPFRAFLEQRAFDGARGRNWLFFGEQHRETDFFYETEFNAFQKQGLLNRFDLAFSRDQPRKIYVQHRMQEHARELWDWVKNGAYLYVCGDARRMAKDVHQTLIDIATKEGGLPAEAAAEFVNVTLMKTEKRYLRDVY